MRPRDRRIFLLRVGMYDGRVWRLSETGALFGITKERVRQICLKCSGLVTVDPSMAEWHDTVSGTYGTGPIGPPVRFFCRRRGHGKRPSGDGLVTPVALSDELEQPGRRPLGGGGEADVEQASAQAA